MKQMTINQVRDMLLFMSDAIIANEPYLTKTDSLIGDGDHGTGMKNGMKAVRQAILEHEEESNVFALFRYAAEAMERSMGGASGMIFSQLFAGSPPGRRADVLTPEDLAGLFHSGLENIQRIGKAKPGDKTMVDALYPAVMSMEKECGSFETMLAAAEKAACEGKEKSKKYRAKYGRAKNLGSRAVGYEDAGAVSTWLIFRQLLNYVTGKKAYVAEVQTGEKKEAQLPGRTKIINDPDDVVRESLEGFMAAYGKDLELVEGVNATVKKQIPTGKPVLLIGGGAGHEPMFSYFVGENLADASVSGNVFASPDPVSIEKTARKAERGGGVLFVYGNYAGDNLNFDKAAEILQRDGIMVRTVRVYDDIASASRNQIRDRRGIAGDVFEIKIAGAACSTVNSLEDAARIAEKARDNIFTIGVGLRAAVVPGKSEPMFSLSEGDMEYGLGIHGEKGIKRVKTETADCIVENLTEQILKESGIGRGDTVCTYINGLGSTTMMELMIMNRKLAQLLEEKQIKVHDMEVNSLVTTLDMAGASVSIMRLDEELKRYYDLPCKSPYYSKF